MSDFTFTTLATIPKLTMHWAINSTNHPDPNDPNAWVPYRYTPSLAAAIIFIICFAITSAVHVWQMFRFRAWFFVPFVLGGLMETIGYIGRAMSTKDIWDLNSFIMQSTLLLVAPAFFAASIYMTLRRIIVLTDDEVYCFLRSRWISRIFVCGDVFSFLVQASGAGMQASGNPSLGQTLIVAGLGIQVAFFALFMIAAVTFHIHAGRFLPAVAPGTDINWIRFIYVLYGVSSLILIRSVFRLIEYGEGNNGSLLRPELSLYISDAVLMFGVMVIMNVWHPGTIKTHLREISKGGYRASNRDVESPFEGEMANMNAGQKV